MKLKASKSEIKNNSYYIIGASYCSIDYLLRYENPFSYCAGVYGWSCDNYEIFTGKNNVTISTGYSYIDDKNIKNKNKYEILKKADEKARKIILNADNWEKAKKQVTKLLYKTIDKIIEESEGVK